MEYRDFYANRRPHAQRQTRGRELLDPVAHYLSFVGPTVDVAEEGRRAIDLLRQATEQPLTASDTPQRPGLYALFLVGRARPVYVGKAAGKRGLRGRMAEHVQTLLLHHNVDPAQVRCRFLPYGRRAPLRQIEAALIRYFRPEWNQVVGFGSGPSRKGLPAVGTWEQRFPRK